MVEGGGQGLAERLLDTDHPKILGVPPWRKGRAGRAGDRTAVHPLIPRVPPRRPRYKAGMPAEPGPTEPPLPARIGRYRVLAPLGAGASSEVFLGHDDFLDRPVAIKRLPPQDPADPQASRLRERFFAAEAALIGRLQHPNLVTLYDAADDPAGPYLVMEPVRGGTLRPHTRPEALLPLDRIVEIGIQLALALAQVARQGLVHRDVKAANLLVERDAAGGIARVKLGDFGSVLNLRADCTQVARVGSLRTMSPEQVEGGTLDGRSDLYALGVVLYQLIAGRPPFEAPSEAALIAQILDRPPPPLQPLRPGVSPALEAVVLGALAKSPAGRPADGEAFAAALSALLADRQVPRPGPQELLDSERFRLLGELDFFAGFGEVERWELVRRGDWAQHPAGTLLHRAGETGDQFHIIARGEVEVHRDGRCVARLGAGTSVGEMAYLAPSPALKRHQADIVCTAPTTTLGFSPARLASLGAATRQQMDQAFIRVLVRRLHAAHEALAHPRRIL